MRSKLTLQLFNIHAALFRHIQLIHIAYHIISLLSIYIWQLDILQFVMEYLICNWLL